MTRPIIDVGLDPMMIRDADLDRLPALANILDLPLAEVQQRALTRTRTVVLEDGSETTRAIRWARLAVVDEVTFDQVMALRIRAVYGNRRFERFYPSGSMAAHLLGFVNREGLRWPAWRGSWTFTCVAKTAGNRRKRMADAANWHNSGIWKYILLTVWAWS
ncbi:MAG: hypothetical protein LR015_15705 [Verrucomicrobia bacterium]|nr:hypothetical protein [Verrucomicrobiota bacterium]